MLNKEDVILDSFLVKDISNKNIASMMARTPMIVIYNRTSDYGNKYVARLWKYKNLNPHRFNSYSPQPRYFPTNYVVIGDSISEIRDKIPLLLNFIPRYKDDDPCILGVYI